MFNRIGGFFIGFMCLFYCISMLANKNVKVGEKFFKFDDTGDLYLLPALGFLLLSIYGFWMAFRKESPVVQRLVGMWCPDCRPSHCLNQNLEIKSEKQKIKFIKNRFFVFYYHTDVNVIFITFL